MTLNCNANVPWYQTSKENSPQTSILKEPISADVVIIGAGVMGLSTALSAIEAGGTVVVLEALDVGAGASGRNGGLIVPIMRASPDSIREAYAESGERLIRTVIKSADSVFKLIDQHRIDCDPVRNGFMQPVHAPKLISSIEKSAIAWSSAGATCEFLDANETEKHLGTNAYHAALFEPAGGYVNPLAYTRGLARVCISRGVEIYTESAVEKAQQVNGNKWKLHTRNGTVTADRVIQCVSAQIPGLPFPPAQEATKSLIPVALHGLATKPLCATIRQKILPTRVAATDTRNFVLSVGYDVENRLITSGAAPLGDGKMGINQMARFVSRRLQRVYPELGPVTFDYVWKGTAALNSDWLPKIFCAENNWYSLTSCNGRGMALSTSIGQMFGKALVSDDLSEMALPIVAPRSLMFRQSLGTMMARLLMPLGAIQDRWRE
jgi:glycine/D-amino acid oxidase-like deaminating enzyme